MLFIDNISFQYEVLYGDNVIVESLVSGVSIEYHVEFKGNKVDSQITIDFDQYKDMTYQDVIDYLTKVFNETIEAVK